MTVSKKMNWAASLTTSAVRRATPARARTRTKTPSSALGSRIDYRLLDEIGAWALLAGVSLVGWLAAAITFGLI